MDCPICATWPLTAGPNGMPWCSVYGRHDGLGSAEREHAAGVQDAAERAGLAVVHDILLYQRDKRRAAEAERSLAQ